MAFDPDKYIQEDIKEEKEFDPDAYVGTPSSDSFDPESYLARPEETTSTTEAVAGGLAKGGSLGFIDEIAGGVQALAETVGLKEDSASVFDTSFADRLKSRYKAGREGYREYQKQLQEEHPATFKTAEVGGAIGTGLIGGAPASTGKLLLRAGAEGAGFGLGESEADLTEGEFKEALIDTGIGAGIGVGTAGVATGGMKALGKGYQKVFGRGGKDLATDAAGDILELTPKQRADAAKDVVKIGPGKTSSVAEELPDYLRERGGIIQSAKKLKQQSKQALKEAGDEIEEVLDSYDGILNKMKESKPDLRNVKGMDEISLGVDESALAIDPERFVQNDLGDTFMNYGRAVEAEKFSNKLGFKFNELADDLLADVDSLRGVPGYENQLAKLDKHIEKLRNFTSSRGDDVIESIKELHAMRKNTDKLIKSFQGPKATQTDALLQEALIKTRRKMSNHLQDNMLGEVKTFAKKALDDKLITQADFDTLVSLQDRIYKANRNYKLANFVDDQIDQAIGRKDARKIFGLTDWILGAQAIHSPWAVPALAAKKGAEIARPRVQLYSRELGKGMKNLGAATRTPVTQQFTQQSVTEKVQGTPYQTVFDGLDKHQQAVRYNLLHQTDENFRKLINGEDEEE